MLTRFSRSPALTATEQRFLARQRRQKQPTKASAKTSHSKSNNAGQRKQKGSTSLSNSSEAKKPAKTGGGKAGSDDVIAHAFNALCLICVQQEQSAAGSVEYDGEIAAGEHFAAEKDLNVLDESGQK